ncbi:MAG: GUN4 domain-containing protein [Cyanobacteria bacterium P01_G01_bin.19]
MLKNTISFITGIVASLSILETASYSQELPLLSKEENSATQIEQLAQCAEISTRKNRDLLSYRQLESFLKVQQWRKADRETLNLMLKAKNRQPDELLSNQDIADFPCQVLSEIDRLWVEYSNGRFGFSTQVKIDDEQCSKYSDFYPAAYRCFAEEVGWLKNNRWIDYSQVEFDISAPSGHLPAVYLLLSDRTLERCPQEGEFSEREITSEERECLGTQLMLGYGGPLSLVYSPTCQIELSEDTPGSLKNDAVAYYNRGGDRYELGNCQGAIDDYTQAIRIDPNLDSAYYNRGNVYLKLKDYQSAIVDYNQAIALDPNMPQAYYNRGNVYRKLEKHQKAIKDYTQSLRTNHHYSHGDGRLLSAYAYNNRALSHRDLGYTQQAIEDFQSSADIHRQLGNKNLYRRAMKQIRKLQSK